jgi:hypothetical protein
MVIADGVLVASKLPEPLGPVAARTLTTTDTRQLDNRHNAAATTIYHSTAALVLQLQSRR